MKTVYLIWVLKRGGKYNLWKESKCKYLYNIGVLEEEEKNIEFN